MLDEFINNLSLELQKIGYKVDLSPQIQGVHGLLYSWSPKRFRLGIAKVEDHFLFVDWDAMVIDRLDQLKEIYRHLSRHVNKGFQTPHALRIQIPNLAVIAISQVEFPQEVRAFARTTSLNPWYGGEVGQIILVEVGKKQVTSLRYLWSGRYPRPGAFALGHASSLIRQFCDRAFSNP